MVLFRVISGKFGWFFSLELLLLAIACVSRLIGGQQGIYAVVSYRPYLMFCFSDKQELETDQGGRHKKKIIIINRKCGLVNHEHHQSTDSQLSF